MSLEFLKTHLDHPPTTHSAIETEEDSEDEEMSEDEEDDSSEEEVIIPQQKGAKNGKNAKKEDSNEEEEDDSEEDDEDEFKPAVMKAAAATPASEEEDEEDEEGEDEDEEDESEDEAMDTTPVKGKKTLAKAMPVKTKTVAEDEDEENDEDEDEEDNEEDGEEEYVKEVPGMRKKEMAKQKAAPEAKKQKVEATEPTTSFHLFLGNLNNNKSIPELKTGITDVFARHDLAVADVCLRTLTRETLKESFDSSIRVRVVIDRETGFSKGFGFVDFNSEEVAKAAKEAMEDGEVDGNKVTLGWAKPKGEGGFGVEVEAEEALEAEVEAGEVDLVAEAKETLEAEVASEEAEEEETIRYKERRRSLSSFSVPLSSLFYLKERTEVDLVAEAKETLEAEVASEEAEEEETIRYKERRRSLSSFSVPLSSLFYLKERTLRFLLCYLITDRAF
ncbi:Nucleolin [Tupaia chinensis]|uniref:Nucleolin n=1 Tax=Tupaia chinensis TaxID=246437 RepID=L9KMG9_TUPCH|nr:Nucleolin [Tupaia chinensis]